MSDTADVDPATTARARGVLPGRRATSRTLVGGVARTGTGRLVGRPVLFPGVGRPAGARHGR